MSNITKDCNKNLSIYNSYTLHCNIKDLSKLHKVTVKNDDVLLVAIKTYAKYENNSEQKYTYNELNYFYFTSDFFMISPDCNR